MEMALYEPGLGYYSAGATKLGAGGDFVTAPEVSSLFSRCLANSVRRNPAARQRRRDSRIRRGLRRDGGRSAQRAGRAGRLAGALSHSRSERGPAGAAARAPARTGAGARGARRMDRSPAGGIPRRRACERSSGRAAGAALSHPRRPDQLAGRDVAARPARLVRDACGCGARGGGAAHRGEHRRAIAGRLHVGDQSAARAVDRRRRGGVARRRGVVHRLWVAAASVLSHASGARARCCATSGIASTTIR